MKRILFALCGTTAQIITETLYALWDKRKMPDKILILTTKRGKETLYENLLDPETGNFYKFCKEYGIDASEIEFSLKSIIVPQNNGAEIEDITTEQDSFCFLQRTLEETYTLTNDPDTEVYFSLTGGRKTMGASLTLAAQLYGRSQDRLYHLLIHPDFENNSKFYYIPKEPQVIEYRNKANEERSVNTKYATITLINIPFVRVCDERFSTEILQRHLKPKEIMECLEKTEEPKLKLHMDSCTIEWQGKTVQLPPVQFTLYAFFCLQKRYHPDKCSLTADEIEAEHKERMNTLYQKINLYNRKNSTKSTLELLEKNIRSNRTKINNKIKETFGQESSHKLSIFSSEKNFSPYTICIEPHLIEIISQEGEQWELI